MTSRLGRPALCSSPCRTSPVVVLYASARSGSQPPSPVLLLQARPRGPDRPMRCACSTNTPQDAVRPSLLSRECGSLGQVRFRQGPCILCGRNRAVWHVEPPLVGRGGSESFPHPCCAPRHGTLPVSRNRRAWTASGGHGP